MTMRKPDDWHERMMMKCACGHTRILHGKTCEVPSCSCQGFRPKAAS